MGQIPHIVHYCWFGGKKKGPQTGKYLNGWRKILKDYEFVEWNEDNFEIGKYPFAEEAYKQKKYAFVSDVARVWALYSMGGIYLDTDVEVCRDFSPCLKDRSMVLGFEMEDHLMTAFLAAEKGSRVMEEMLRYYEKQSFEEGGAGEQVNTLLLTALLEKRGLKRSGKHQILEENVEIFPVDYFTAYRLRGEQILRTGNTYTIHHFSASWKPWDVRLKKYCKQMIRRLLGQETLDQILEGRNRGGENAEKTGY